MGFFRLADFVASIPGFSEAVGVEGGEIDGDEIDGDGHCKYVCAVTDVEFV